MEQFVQILLYLGAIQGFLLFWFLFTVKKNRLSNRLLGLLTLFWAIVLLQFPLQQEGLYSNYPHLLKTISNLLFAFFPLLYLHVKYLLSDYKKFDYRDLWHFLPLLINIILHGEFFLMGGEEKIDIIRNQNDYYRIVGIVGDEIIAIQGILYSFLVFRRLNRYSKEIEHYQSSVNKTTLQVLLIGTSLTLISWLIGTVGINLDFFDIKVSVDLFMYVYLILVLVIYFISYMSLKTPEMYKLTKEFRDIEEDTEEELIAASQYKPLELIEEQDEKTQELLDRLQLFMEEEKPYIDADLGLQELADQLEVSRHQLSLLINQQHHMNFYEFVNSHRVREVQGLMQKPDNKNIKLMNLAYDAGFNSKSSFNRIFKQLVGITPSQYFSSLTMEQAKDSK